MDKNKQTISFSVYLSLKELTKQSSGNDKGKKPVLNGFLSFITNWQNENSCGGYCYSWTVEFQLIIRLTNVQNLTFYWIFISIS